MKSFKETLIIALSALLNDKRFKGNRLILTTPAGIISGKLVSDNQDNDESDIGADISYMCDKIVNKYYNVPPLEEPKLSDNDSYLILADVEISSSDATLVRRLPFMIVFVNQIIGASFGHIN